MNPIPGLYAAGELVGGIFYFNYPGGSGLMSGPCSADRRHGRRGRNAECITRRVTHRCLRVIARGIVGLCPGAVTA